MEVKIHTVRFTASAIGVFIAALPGVKYGPLINRHMETDKNQALRRGKGDYNSTMSFSAAALTEVQWWHDNISHVHHFIHAPAVCLTIHSDASLDGWGTTDGVHTMGGPWDHTHELPHINTLELFAAKLAVEALAGHIKNSHIHLKLDNQTAVTYINKKGRKHSKNCNDISLQVWHWAKIHGNWLSAAYIPGESNVVADFHSRHFKENTEWTLNPQVYKNVCDYFTIPTIDLFAAANNNKVETYVSWLPDPGAYAVDAFTFLWPCINVYAFPPFSLVAKVLAKIIRDTVTGWMIVPKWATQSWFPVMLNMLINPPLHLSSDRFLLTLPNRPGASHPLAKKLHLLAVHLSGNPLKPLIYQQKLQNSSNSPGGPLPWGDMTPLCKDGEHFVLKGRWIQCVPL